MSIKKESVEPISFISEEVVVEPWRKWTTSNTPHPYRYDDWEAYTAPFATLVYTRMSVVRASFLHWNYHISSEGQCENTFNMSAELLQHHKFRNYFQITDNTQGIELQNSTIFFKFLSLVEITCKYDIYKLIPYGIYDFAFGLNWNGVISDSRVKTHGKHWFRLISIDNIPV